MPTDISFFSPLNFQRYISVFLNRVQIFQVFLFVLLHFVLGQINPDIFNRLSQYVIHTKSVFSKGILDFLIKCQRIHFFKIRGAEIINLRVWNPIPYHCTFNCGTGIFLFNQQKETAFRQPLNQSPKIRIRRYQNESFCSLFKIFPCCSDSQRNVH